MKKKHGNCDKCLYTVTSNQKETILCTHSLGKYIKMTGSDGCEHYTPAKLNKLVLALIACVILIYLTGMGTIVYDAIMKK